MDTSEEKLKHQAKLPTDTDLESVSFTPVANIGDGQVEKPV